MDDAGTGAEVRVYNGSLHQVGGTITAPAGAGSSFGTAETATTRGTIRLIGGTLANGGVGASYLYTGSNTSPSIEFRPYVERRNPDNTTVMVDGQMVNGLQGDGAIQSYFNDAMNAEVSYQTAAIGAETSSGGVRLNMIPREGGNRWSGDFKIVSQRN